MKPFCALLLALLAVPGFSRAAGAEAGALAGQRPRVLVSTDIGGTDPDDFQPDGAGSVCFRFCPKEAKPYRYTFKGNVPAPVGSAGEISIFAAAPEAGLRPDPLLPHWWTDDPGSGLAEGPHEGARSVSQWREQFLSDFADRLERCR